MKTQRIIKKNLFVFIFIFQLLAPIEGIAAVTANLMHHL